LPLHLPEPDRRELPRAQLPLVLCQIRFEPLPLATDPKVAIAIQDQLGGRTGPYPRTEPMQNLTLSPGALGGAIAATTGWRFISQAGDWIAAVQSDQTSLETTAYSTWDEFRDRLFALIDAVSAHLTPASVTRVGLRYSNRLTDPQVADPRDWGQYLAPELLGLLVHDGLSEGVIAAQQQVDFDPDGEAKSTLRHGFFRDDQAAGRLTYVLDFDSYREGFRAWDTDAIKQTAVGFNDLTLQLFQQIVTPDLLAYLRGENDNAGNA
jgi:uncharacterized protein (TIGR04255 family)